MEAGGLPLMLANLEPELVPDYLRLADGVVLTGGADLDPESYGAAPHPQLEVVDRKRDLFEFALYRAAGAAGIPVLGICRGIQLINVAEGGSLHQHLPAVTGTLQHTQVDTGGAPLHPVTLELHSSLARVFGRLRIRTNSYHHQAIAELGCNLEVIARTDDGVIEAVEGSSDSFLLAVQWHPEMSFQAFPEQILPFRIFLEAVRQRLSVRD